MTLWGDYGGIMDGVNNTLYGHLNTRVAKSSLYENLGALCMS